MSETITTERRGHVLLIGLNRADKRNAFTLEMLDELALAVGTLEDDPELRCGVLFAHGDHFTAGLDLGNVSPKLQAEGSLSTPAGGRQPWRLDGEPYTTPLVCAVQGWCLTIGIELMLASDVRVAAASTRFKQLEVQRGIYPFCGATLRMPREAGWGNAMRWLLTGDEFDAAEAHRIGLVQEVVEPGQELERAIWLAERIANVAAPLGIRETLLSAQAAIPAAEREAATGLQRAAIPLMQSEDGAEGLNSFLERREARFAGR